MKSISVIVATVVALTGGAHAADLSAPPAQTVWEPPAAEAPARGDRFYAALFGGVAFSEGVDYSSSNEINYLGDGTMNLDTGYSIDGAIGYAHEKGLMLEGQIGYAALAPNSATYYSVGTDTDYEFGADGQISVLYAMANLWYGFDMGGFTPFAGGGIGYARISLDAQYDAPFSAASFEASADTYAWQVGAGVAVDITPTVELVARYRYLATGEVTVIDGQGSSVKASLATSIVDAGLRAGF